MCPASASWAENPGDALSHGGGGSAAAAGGGSTPDADASGVSSDETPDAPPRQVVITFAYDMDPVIEPGHGMSDGLLLYVLDKTTTLHEESMGLTPNRVEDNCDTEEE